MDVNATVLNELQQIIADCTRSLAALLACDRMVPSANTLGESEPTLPHEFLLCAGAACQALILLANAQARERRDGVRAVVSSTPRLLHECQAAVRAPIPQSPLTLRQQQTKLKCRFQQSTSLGDEIVDLLDNELSESSRAAKLQAELQIIKRTEEGRCMWSASTQEKNFVVGPTSPNEQSVSASERGLERLHHI